MQIVMLYSLLPHHFPYNIWSKSCLYSVQQCVLDKDGLILHTGEVKGHVSDNSITIFSVRVLSFSRCVSRQ